MATILLAPRGLIRKTLPACRAPAREKIQKLYLYAAMRSLADVLRRKPEFRDGFHDARPSPKASRTYRHDARFVLDLREVSTPLNRDERGRLIRQAEQIELRSKAKGRRNGILGLTGLQVLRVLVFKFANRVSGLCIPSYCAIMKQTGLCKQTVCSALRRLEACGILRVVRRLVRRMVQRGGVQVRATVQGSNCYSFKLGGVVAIETGGAKTAPPIFPRSFPKPRATLALLFGRATNADRHYLRPAAESAG